MQPIYIVIDTEATGLHLNKCGLIQLACLTLDENFKEVDRICVDVKPDGEYEVVEEALQINGFTQERIDNGISYKEMCKVFLEFLKKNFESTDASTGESSIFQPMVIAQFWPFDYAFLQGVFGSCDMHLELAKYITNNFVDTKAIVNYLNIKAKFACKPLPFPITSLSKPGGLKDTFDLDQKDLVAHDALGDCLATTLVLKKLVEL
jgi:DNA polymerase III epsilon subunit-like protein